MIRYQHTQPGHVVRWGLGLGALFVLATTLPLMFIEVEYGIIPLAVIAILGVAAYLFHSLTVQITESHLRLWFGPGVLKRRWALAEIVSLQAVRNPWWYGWGIHLTPRGWIYNVSGREGIEIELASGRRVRIGTDEPGEVVRAVAVAREAASL